MNNLSNQNSESFNSDVLGNNSLWQYVQSLSPETITQLSKPSSPQVLQAIEHTIFSMLGGLPSEQFDVMITTDRDSLGKLLASAMINGYLLRNIEQRLELEKSLQ